jgi:hypothetical protein
MVKIKKVIKYETNKCSLCDRGITLIQMRFEMGICPMCSTDIPSHIPWSQTHKYLVGKILKRKKMKSLEDHVKEFTIPIGKYKELPLVECTDLDWLDWYVKSDFSSRWQKKLINWYIDDIAKDIKIEIDLDRQVENDQTQTEYNELKNGAWVDENF